MTSGPVSTAIKTYVTEYSVRQKNDIVDTIPGVVNETLRVADLSDVPVIATKLDDLCAGVRDEVAQATARVPDMIRSAFDDYQIATATRDADRLDAAKEKLLTWFQENFQKELASLVSAAMEPHAQKIQDLSTKMALLQADVAMHRMERDSGKLTGTTPIVSAVYPSKVSDIPDTPDMDHQQGIPKPQVSVKVKGTDGYPPSHGEGPGSESSRRSRRSRRGSRKNRSRDRRDRSRSRSSNGHSSDDSDSSSNSESDLDRQRPNRRFRPWKPTDHRFHKACDYRTYRLENGRGRMDARTNRSTRKKVKDLEVTMTGHKFDGKDPIKVIGFLRRLKRDADRNDMSEGSLYLALPYMLRGEAQDAFEAAQDDGNSRRNVKNWVTGCDWLLRTYATNANIADAMLDLSRTKQSAEEDETKYSTRLRNAVKRCGNVHTEYEVATFFVQGLIAAISPRVAQERSRNSKLEYVDLVQYARSEGDAVRAQTRIGKTRLSYPDKLPRRTVNFIAEDPEESRSTVTIDASARDTDADMNLVGDGGATVSAPSYMSGTATDTTEGEAFYAYQPRFRNDRLARQGREAYPRNRDARQSSGMELICHECYLPGHISPRCEMKLKDLHQVPENYGKLTVEQKSRVPDSSYLRVVAALNLQVEEKKPAVPKN